MKANRKRSGFLGVPLRTDLSTLWGPRTFLWEFLPSHVGTRVFRSPGSLWTLWDTLFSGFELSQHLNVGGLTRSVSVPLYSAVTQPTFISVNSVFPTAVSLCPSNVSLVPSAIPAPSILQFSLNSVSNPSSLNSYLHRPKSRCSFSILLISKFFTSVSQFVPES